MKKVLLLPGNSASNKDWSDAWAAALEKVGVNLKEARANNKNEKV